MFAKTESTFRTNDDRVQIVVVTFIISDLKTAKKRIGERLRTFGQ